MTTTLFKDGFIYVRPELEVVVCDREHNSFVVVVSPFQAIGIAEDLLEQARRKLVDTLK
jgi:hypothetical protein